VTHLISLLDVTDGPATKRERSGI